jgi:cardiolipin synthase (CMP-forming)
VTSRPSIRTTTAEGIRTAVLTTANQLTILRIIFIPVFIFFLTEGRNGLAFAIFVAAGVTDVFDGIIARRFRQKTSVGTVLDPLADKLLMVTSIVLLSLPQMQLPNMLPRWLTILLISRDVLMMLVALVIVLMVGWRFFKPSIYGKANTALQVTTVLTVLYCNWKGWVVPQLYILYYITGAMTAFSGLHYLVTGRDRVGIE